jgi:hypothetical protein
MYTPPRPSPLPADYEEFLKSLSDQERRLLEIAKKELASSFFPQWCRLYEAWKAKQGPKKN